MDAFIGAFIGFLGGWLLQWLGQRQAKKQAEANRRQLVHASLVALEKSIAANSHLCSFEKTHFWPQLRLEYKAWDCIAPILSEHLKDPELLRDLSLYFHRVGLYEQMTVARSQSSNDKEAICNDVTGGYIVDMVNELRKAYDPDGLHAKLKERIEPVLLKNAPKNHTLHHK